MATGDAAGAAGLVVYDDTLNVRDIDTALNQRGDELAAVMGRTKKVESLVGTPKFIVNRSSAGQNIQGNTWTQLTAPAFATPMKRVGGFEWSGGVLRIPRAGIYQVAAHVFFRSDDYAGAELQITRNSTDVDTTATITGDGISIPAPDAGSTVNLGLTASRLVSLNANDALRLFVRQSNRGQNTVNVGSFAFDLTFDVVWVDEQ
ncbi:hypothetical protein [Curtobacterium flaccumfaciens]|uniref:hypothetical protein n=1 Tax=Curtobacterium flaccumfaciens TaxID=2035 RepID=UPI00265A5DB5|nr:hypothetical protein [Curtobacterium flaccumfaciens]MCS0491193.1 hypothetical protein [Curtobacterium flaccumfaciens pv. betae]